MNMLLLFKKRCQNCSLNTYQQKVNFDIGGEVFTLSMSKSFSKLFGFNTQVKESYTSYTSDNICDQTPNDYLKIDVNFANLNRGINQNTISLIHCQVPSYYKFSSMDNLFSMRVTRESLLGSIITIRILNPITDEIVRLNSDYTLVFNIQPE